MAFWVKIILDPNVIISKKQLLQNEQKGSVSYFSVRLFRFSSHVHNAGRRNLFCLHRDNYSFTVFLRGSLLQHSHYLASSLARFDAYFPKKRKRKTLLNHVFDLQCWSLHIELTRLQSELKLSLMAR